MFCLRMIIIHGLNTTFKWIESYRQKVFRFLYVVENFIRDFIHLHISRLCRQHHGNEKLKRSRVVQLSFWIWEKLFKICEYDAKFFIHTIGIFFLSPNAIQDNKFFIEVSTNIKICKIPSYRYKLTRHNYLVIYIHVTYWKS